MEKNELYRWVAGIALGLLLALASRFGVKPAPIPIVQVSPELDGKILVKVSN